MTDPAAVAQAVAAWLDEFRGDAAALARGAAKSYQAHLYGSPEDGYYWSRAEIEEFGRKCAENLAYHIAAGLLRFEPRTSLAAAVEAAAGEQG